MTPSTSASSGLYVRPGSAPARAQTEGPPAPEVHELQRVKLRLMCNRHRIEAFQQHLDQIKGHTGYPNPTELEQLNEVTRELSKLKLHDGTFIAKLHDISSPHSDVSSPSSLTFSERGLCDELILEELERDCNDMLGVISREADSIEARIGAIAHSRLPRRCESPKALSFAERQLMTVGEELAFEHHEPASLPELFHPDFSPNRSLPS